MPKTLDYNLIAPGVSSTVQLLVPRLASDPGTPVAGEIWFNTADEIYRVYDGTTIIDLGASGAGGDAATLEGEDGAFYLDRDNHTGTQVAATIADLAAAVGSIVAGLSIDAATLEGDDLATIQTAIIAAIVDAAPGTLNTLNEIVAALGDDPNFVTTITNLIAAKAGHYSVAMTGGATTEVITHNLNTRNVLVGFHKTATTYDADRDWLWQATSVNTITVVSEAGNIPAGYTVTVVGK